MNVKEHKQEDIKTKGDCCFNHIIIVSLILDYNKCRVMRKTKKDKRVFGHSYQYRNILHGKNMAV